MRTSNTFDLLAWDFIGSYLKSYFVRYLSKELRNIKASLYNLMECKQHTKKKIKWIPGNRLLMCSLNLIIS
jgi:hypothetical protein